MQIDTYKTIASHVVHEIPKVKSSRFIAEAIPVADLEAAESALAIIRKREYNATHHCWAWRLGTERVDFRYSDDGEPSGTAGAPIHRHLEGRDLTNVLVVVIRYYGGTKLGTGGLIRAYSDAALAVLEACEVVEHIKRTSISLRFAYNDTSAAMHCIQKFDAPILETHYDHDTTLILGVRRSEVDALQRAFVEALGGRGVMALGDW